MNNFKRLGQFHEDRFPRKKEERKVSSDYFFFRHVGNVIDHFLGRALDMFVSLSGGNAGPKAPPDQGNDPFDDVPPMRH